MKKFLCMILGIAILMGTITAVAYATSENDIKTQQTMLNVVWEVITGNDRMSTIDASEAARFTMQGQMYYVPRSSHSTRNTLFRLFNNVEHMTSTTSNEGGYFMENILGYPWKAGSKPNGTALMFRGYNSSNGDHGLMSDHYSISGYTRENLSDCYAYHRFGGNTVPLLTLTGNKITIKSNLAAGGSIWEWVWNGKQFVDSYDYGREIQSSMSFINNKALPTEGGDKYRPSDDKQYWHGSPIITYGNSITPNAKTQTTRAAPLEWMYTDYNGGLENVPVVYAGWQLGKDIKLDDTTLNLGSGFEYLRDQVVKYDTVLYTPITLTQANIEIPTAYLKAEFNRAFSFDASKTDINQGTHEITNSEFNNLETGVYHKQFEVPAGGAIYATQDLKYALGVYGSTPENGGDAVYFTVWKFGSLNNPSVTKWSAGNGWSTFPAGENRFTTYIISGTLDDVRAAMRRLYIMNYR